MLLFRFPFSICQIKLGTSSRVNYVSNLYRLNVENYRVCLINVLGKNLVLHCLGGPHSIISFFQYFLAFNITSITFYYSLNKKITTKQNFSFFYAKHSSKHSYFFYFLKKKTFLFFFHFFQFLLQCKTETKSFIKRTHIVRLMILNTFEKF